MVHWFRKAQALVAALHQIDFVELGVEEDSTAEEVAAHSAGCTGFKVWRTAIIASS